MDAEGKTVVITGATAGLGESAAEHLARAGARVVFTARDRSRGENLLGRLRAANPAQEHAAVYGDLSSLAEMKRVGAELAAMLPRVDVLANNAGGWFDTRQETEDGLELTFALNHMAYFVLTNALLETINATPNARVSNTASSAYGVGPLDFNDMQTTQDYTMIKAYGRSKLCNVLFTRALARRLAPGRTTSTFHPGAVLTQMWGANEQAKGMATTFWSKSDASTLEQGTDRILWHALAPEPAQHNGAYFDGHNLVEVAPFARDDEAAERLWKVSEEIAAGAG